MNDEAHIASPAASVRSVAVAEGYTRWAPLYDQTPNPLLAREERFLLPRLPDLRNRSVLDSACGTGRWLAKLMGLGSAFGVGIDTSPAMLRVAAARPSAATIARADCEHLPFSNGTFDLVICSFAVGHISSLDAMARELARVTQPNADVFVSDLHPDAHAQGWRVGFRDGDVAIEIQTQDRTAEEIVEAFCSHGFKCRMNVTLSLGEPERSLFTRAGKAHFFAEACRMPAVFVCQFQRLHSPLTTGKRDER